MVIQTVFNLLAGDIRDSNRMTLITVKTADIPNFVNILAKKIFPAKLLGMVTVFDYYTAIYALRSGKIETFFFGNVFTVFVQIF